MSFVVDCSVAARWLLPDESTPYTDMVFELLGTRDAVVPPLFVAECANVFLKLARQKRLDPDVAHDAVRAIGELGLEIDRNPVTPNACSSWRIGMVFLPTTRRISNSPCDADCRLPASTAACARRQSVPG